MPNARHCEPANLATVLPRLVSAYESGRLVPFIGAGLSAPACRLWQPFIAELEKAANLPAAVDEGKPESLVMRANRAIARLRALGTPTLADKVRAALFPPSPDMPAQTD